MTKKLTLKTTALLIFFVAFVFFVKTAASYFGVITTPSVDFTFYYHTPLSQEVKVGDYLLFNFPPNQLYKTGIPVVKRVACMGGQKLVTYQDKTQIIYACDGVVISRITLFNRSNNEALDIFMFEGIIPEDNYFMIGDNDNSYDSKYWGFVAHENLLRIVHPLALSNYILKPANAADNFYAERNKGWYKYEPAPIEVDNVSTLDNITIPKRLTKPVLPPLEQLSIMPTEEFAKLFKEVESYAMTYRSLENFDTFAKMRSVMVARAMEFTNVATLWAQLNPEDTSESWFPTSGFGQDVYRKQTSQIRMDYIRSNKDNYGIVYFYRDDCTYCQQQTPLIKYFEDATGWSVKRVDTEMMPEAMLRFNIQTVPTLILAERETKRFLPLSSGLTTYEEIEERLYRTIKYLKGESDEKNFSDPIRPDNFVNK